MLFRSENQSKLLSLETVFNGLESKIDDADSNGLGLRKELDKIHKSNSKLIKKLVKSSSNSGMDVLLTIWVFELAPQIVSQTTATNNFSLSFFLCLYV